MVLKILKMYAKILKMARVPFFVIINCVVIGLKIKKLGEIIIVLNNNFIVIYNTL